MLNIHVFALFSVLLCYVCYLALSKDKLGSTSGFALKAVYIVLGVGLLVRVIIAATDGGFSYDMTSFAAWADRMYSVGPGNFYSADVLTDYPPLYMYVLYVVGWLRSAFQIEWMSPSHLVLLKLPAILFDIALSYLIYRVAKKYLEPVKALFLMSAYLFLPAVIVDSAAWGQVDSPHTLMIVLMCLFLMKGNMVPAYFAYVIGVLFKPHTLIFTPVLLIGIVDHVFLDHFSWKKLFTNLAGGVAALASAVVISLPFGLTNVLHQYVDTLGSYSYATVNAYNFWALFGLSWVSQDTRFLFLPAKTWGTIVIVLIVASVFYFSHRMKKDPAKYVLLGAYIALTMFTFSVRMHERYSFPAFALLLLAYLFKPEKPLWIAYSGLAVLFYYNTAHVLRFYDPHNYDREHPFILIISAAMVLFYVYFLFIVLRHASLRQVVPDTETKPSAPSLRTGLKERFLTPREPVPSTAKTRLTRLDLCLLAALTLLYSGFALFDLGDREAPVTTFDLVSGQSISLEFAAGEFPATMAYYIAPPHDRVFKTAYQGEGDQGWSESGDIGMESVFTWHHLPLDDGMRRYRLTLSEADASLIELSFLDKDGKLVTPLNSSEYPTLFDEAHLHPAHASFRNGMYFDEIFHGRTAYEYLNGLTTYENTHPPLGKAFISLGVALFGMNPFGWRIVGTLFGIAMLPIFYLFAKRLTKNTPISALATFLFAFDFMHFTQTRIATIDVYATFFVILMYFFMHRYTVTSFYDTDLKKTFIPLGLSGLTFGIAVAVKWTGLYAGLGLAILFFASLYRRYREYRYAKLAPEDSSNGISHAVILKRFTPNVYKTILFCLVFFIALPALIYLLSYLPFVDPYRPGLVSRMLANQASMFDYHSNMNLTHPYASIWLQWPIMVRPMWYYSRQVSDTIREGISAFGNPLVWWAGIPAFFYQLKLLWTKRTSRLETVSRNELYTSAFLVTGYLAVYLPWVLVSRLTFIYHYFMPVPFVILMIAHSLMQWKKSVSKRRFLIVITAYAVLTFGLFLLFYPVLSGQPVDKTFVDRFLRWLPGWVLVSG